MAWEDVDLPRWAWPVLIGLAIYLTALALLAMHTTPLVFPVGIIWAAWMWTRLLSLKR